MADRLSQFGLAALVLALDGRITGCSPPASRLLNRRAGDVVGTDIRDIVGQRDAPAVDRALADAAAGRTWEGLLAVKRPDRRRRDEVTLCWQPIMDAVGQPSAIIVTPATPVAPGECADPPRGAAAQELALLNQASQRIGSTLNLSRTAQEVIDVAVPGFADGGGVYVLEQLLADEEFPHSEPDGTVVARRLAIGTTEGDAADWAALFPPDEVVVFSPDTPFARCLADGKPAYFTLASRREPDIRYPWDGTFAEKLLREASFLATPLRARGHTLGVIAFSRVRGRGFPTDDVAIAQELTARAAISIDNARLYRRERRTALALQESLLATDLTPPPGVELAYRCLPASDTAHVGGDWYDVIPLPRGRVALVVGDAMGHGVSAAAAMGHLRTAVRTLASLDLPPADVLYRLDQMAQGLRNAQFATCVYAVIDPATHVCTLACAGHVPPVLVHPDRTTSMIEPPPGLPLGVGDADGAFQAIQFHIPDDAVLALYTDGLVEGRKRDLDTGTGALRTALGNRHDTLEATCEAVITALHPPLDQDDVTLLLASISPGAASPNPSG